MGGGQWVGLLHQNSGVRSCACRASQTDELETYPTGVNTQVAIAFLESVYKLMPPSELCSCCVALLQGCRCAARYFTVPGEPCRQVSRFLFGLASMDFPVFVSGCSEPCSFHESGYGNWLCVLLRFLSLSLS